MHSPSTTDLSKIRLNLQNSPADAQNVVLIKTGALNPIHRSHISNLIKTKQYLENVHHLNVVGGFISPTHDEYVESKLGDELIPGQLRIELCEKAIEEENQQDWLAVDKAECMARAFISLRTVTISLQDFLNKEFKLNKPIRVIYVAGLDLFNRCNGFHSLTNGQTGGVAVIYRSGETQSLIQSILRQTPKNLYFVSVDSYDPEAFTDISSTLIRRKLRLNEDCSHLTYHSVLNSLQMKKIDSD